jgi:ankyrin repeat protein
MAAANYGSVDIANLLLQNGAKINDKNSYGSKSIEYACCGLNINVVRLLLANGVDINSMCLFDIFYQGDLVVDEIQVQIELLKLLKNKNIDVNIRNGKGKTALMYIVQYSDYAESKLF